MSRSRTNLLPASLVFGILLGLASAIPAAAVVLYDEGQLTIDGVTLLRDRDDPTAYYYIPPYPRVAIDPETGAPEMLLALYVGDEEETTGLFHFLFTLQLPDDVVDSIRRKLGDEVEGAVLRGPVPLLLNEDDEGRPATFQVVSTSLGSGGEAESRLVTSGIAPITPGSKAVVAARLDEQGATLLHNSLTGATSDVSIGVTAYYEAALAAYEGTVSANLETVYEHFLTLRNRQVNYTKQELRDQFDELARTGVVEIDVMDRAGIAVDANQVSALLDMVSTKLIDMLFDTTVGLSALPEREQVPEDIVRGRQQQGYFLQVFGDNDNPKYVTDNQLTLRSRKDIRRGTFSLRFSQSTTIRVPFNTAGNIRGFFEEWSKDSRVFKIITAESSVFKRREVHFQIEPSYTAAFGDVINSVSVLVRKAYEREGVLPYSGEVNFVQKDVSDGTFGKTLTYPLLGEADATSHAFQYREIWSFRGGQIVTVPEAADEWVEALGGVVNLAPPKDKVDVFLEVQEGDAFDGVRRTTFSVEYRLLGRKKVLTKSFRPGELDENYIETSFFADEGAPYRSRTTWLLEDSTTIRGAWADGAGPTLEVAVSGPPEGGTDS